MRGLIPQDAKVHAALRIAARAGLSSNIRTEHLRLFSASATPRAVASGDRSGLWTLINARNVRFARSVLRSALLQAQAFIVHCTKRIAAPDVCAALGISACADFHLSICLAESGCAVEG